MSGSLSNTITKPANVFQGCVHIKACLLELLDGLGLEQHVDQPTHRDGHTYDLTITRFSESLVASKPVVDQFISDQGPVQTWSLRGNLQLQEDQVN